MSNAENVVGAVVLKGEAYYWKRVERDLDAYLEGGPDNELQNVMMANYYGVGAGVVRRIWASARVERAKEKGLVG